MKGQRKRGTCLRFRLCSVLLVIVIIGNVLTFRTSQVKADDMVTLGEYVITLYASMGVGISNPAVISAFQTHLGSGIAVGTDAIQTAISACEQAMGNTMISSTFASTAESTAEYVATVGAGNLAGATTSTATAAENIAASIANYEAYGFVAPVQGGTSLLATVGMSALAVAAGVVAGIALNQFVNFITPYINAGLGLLDENLASRYGYGVGAYLWDNGNASSSPYFYGDNGNSGVIVGNYEDENGAYVWIVNNSSNPINIRYYFHRNNGSSPSTGLLPSGAYDINYARGDPAPNGKRVWGGVNGDPLEYIRKPKPPLISPDIITNNGNASTTLPIEAPQKEDTPYLQPIPWEVYEPWAETAAQNTTEGETGTEQGTEFQELTDPFWEQQTDPQGIPQGTLSTPAPVNPAQPTYMPAPTTQPVPTGGVQPEPTAMPQVEPAPTLTPAEQEQTLQDSTILNLRNFFPFCIPFDLVDMFRKMDVERKAPVIRWQTDFGEWGSFGEIVLDMSMFDQAAAVCRTFELLLFLAGLMVATKNLIGWGG